MQNPGSNAGVFVSDIERIATRTPLHQIVQTLRWKILRKEP
jgi:hypothetical protein